MGYLDYRIELNVRDTVSNVLLNVKRNDRGRSIFVTLKDDRDIFPLPQGAAAVFSARKPDGNVIYNSCTLEGGCICTPITGQLTAVPGIVSCEIKLLGEGGEQLTCALFSLAVEQTVFDQGDIPGSASEIGLVADIVQSASQALSQSQQVLANARDASQRAEGVLQEAEAAASRANAAAEQAEGASEAAVEANRKADALREVVSAFHSVNVEATGDFLHLTDSAEGPLQRLVLYGKTTQSATPSPDAPAALVSPGADGTLTVTAAGKNLLPYPYYDGESKTMGGITYTANADGSVTVNGTATEGSYFILIQHDPLPSGSYMISGCPVGGSSAGYCIASNGFNATTKDIGNGMPITVTEDTLQTNVIIRVMTGTAVNNLKFYPQIEAGTEKTAYDPYKASTLALSTPNGLCGIPVTSGGNYTDETGQQWICDEVDLNRGVLVKRTKIIDLSAKNNWDTWGVNNAAEGMTGFFCYEYAEKILADAPCLSTIAPYNGNIYGGSGIGAAIFGGSAPYYVVSVSNSHLADVSSASAAVQSFQAVLSNTAAKMCVAVEPVETPLSEEERIWYTKLSTRYPTTNMFTDGGANLETVYLADTKTYIDRKFDQLAQVMLNG